MRPSSTDPVEEVIDAYDRIALRYRDVRSASFQERRFIDLLISDLPSRGKVLDVGCGCATPISRYLVDKGFRVTGLDASKGQLDLARAAVPEMVLLHEDMRSAEFGNLFDALVAWDSVFHIPRLEQEALFCRFYSWLRPGGTLLISLGGSAGEIRSDMLGESFFYSSHDPKDSVKLLESAEFEMLHEEMDDSSSGGHFVVVGRARPTRHTVK